MNRKIDKKKAISSPAFLLFITLLLIFGMIWLIAISKMFAVNREDIQKEILNQIEGIKKEGGIKKRGGEKVKDIYREPID